MASLAKFYPAISEDVIALQKRLLDEANELDATKSALYRFTKTVSFYKQQLSALVTSSSTTPQAKTLQIKELLQTFESEVRGGDEVGRSMRYRGDGINAVRESNQVLKQSLEETHRRCESLNADMMHQTDANEELVDNLGKVKDANKRLLEQIRGQTEQITHLTSQRITDEEKMDYLTRTHQHDRDVFRQEAQRQIVMLRETAKEQYSNERAQLADKLHYIKTKTQHVQHGSATFTEEQKRLRKDVDSMAELVKTLLRRVESEAAGKCTAQIDAHKAKCATSQDAIADLEEQHRVESEVRQSEALSWGHRHGSHAADKEDVQARMVRDICQLSAQLQAMERTQEIERSSWNEESERLTKRTDDTATQKLARQEQCDQLKRRSDELESMIKSSEFDLATQQQVVFELRRAVCESDDALAAAVSGNEHLRAQMEEQRKYFQEQNESDLGDCRSVCEQKMHSMQLLNDVEKNANMKQSQLMEEHATKVEDCAQGESTKLETVAAESELLQRNVCNWRGQHDDLTTARGNLEKDFSERQIQFVEDRLQLQHDNEQLATFIALTEDEIHRTLEHLEEFQRVAAARETDYDTRYSAAHGSLRDAEEERNALQQRLRELADTYARVGNDLDANRQRADDALSGLGQSVASKRQELADERDRNARALKAQKQLTEEAMQEVEHERQSNALALQRLQDQSKDKLDVVGREKHRTEETLRSELLSKREAVIHEQKHCESLEQDGARVRSLLQESEANLAWVHQEVDREDRDTSMLLRQLTEDVNATRNLFSKATQDEANLTRQIEEVTRHGDREHKHLHRELDGAQHSLAEAVTEAETRVQRAKSELEMDFHNRQERAHNAAVADRALGESIEREHSQFPSAHTDRSHLSCIGGIGPSVVNVPIGAPSGVSLPTLHQRLEGHINRLQAHTEGLRKSLRQGQGDEVPGNRSTFAEPSTLSTPWLSGQAMGPAYSPAAQGGLGSASTEASMLSAARIPKTLASSVH